jgi:predicted Rossmann fold flavoprotein
VKDYDIAVIGAGPAGMMAAIRAGQRNRKVVLLEKNDSVGRKILITGKGRCNITNSSKADIFIEKFGRAGQFLRTAFSKFSNEDLMNFFESNGLKLKSERQGRVFPEDDSSRSVVNLLLKCMQDNKVDIVYKSRIKNIKRGKDGFALETGQGVITVKKVILATGGASYSQTGSSGDGFQMAKELGHKIVPLRPGLVPLKAGEEWVKELQGLTLKNVRITFVAGKKKMVSDVGEMLITHFGVSGPLVLDLSGDIVPLLEEHKQVLLLIDLKPGIKSEEMEEKLLRDFKEHGGKEAKNMLHSMMPVALASVVVRLAGIKADKKVNQLGRDERRALARLLKGLPLTITGALPIEEAMVTCGGVSIKDIDPRTMESRVVPGLYFAGEMIEGGASSGGYNLQQAFSTGYLAGEKA